jgi:alkyl hydroperoxide reductase subunit D
VPALDPFKRRAEAMSIEALKQRLPEYARDQRLNLDALLGETLLSEQQRWGTFVAAALASRNREVIAAIIDEAAPHLTPEALAAAKAAASIMAMNNIYYRFVELDHDADYKAMPVRLRMSVIGRPGVDKRDFELWALAVSAINGCGSCINAHDRALKQAGMAKEAIQQAVRIAAVVHALAATLDGEAALAEPRAALEA